MNTRGGFTLIEILSVIAILAVLGVGSITALRSIRRSSLRQQAAAEASEIANAVLRYREIHGTWPLESTVEEGDATALIAGVSSDANPADGLKKRDIPLGKLIHEITENTTLPLQLPLRCFRENGNEGEDYRELIPHDPWGRPYVVVMASAVRNEGRLSRTVSHIEGGVYAADIRSGTDSYTVDSPEDVVVFSWGDPLMRTNSTAPSRVIGSWRVIR